MRRSRPLPHGIRRGGPVIIDELSPERAREIGIRISQVHHPDIVDVHVALAAAERGHAILTFDGDIAKVDADLVLIHG
jgi:predicted nucleic acid-binding protein